jgi:hypothetical protein
MSLNITYEQAKDLHKGFFPADFYLCENFTKNQIGYFATDGETFVITRTAVLNAGKITKTITFSKSQISRIVSKKYSTVIILNTGHEKLRPSSFEWFVLIVCVPMALICGIIVTWGLLLLFWIFTAPFWLGNQIRMLQGRYVRVKRLPFTSFENSGKYDLEFFEYMNHLSAEINRK